MFSMLRSKVRFLLARWLSNFFHFFWFRLSLFFGLRIHGLYKFIWVYWLGIDRFVDISSWSNRHLNTWIVFRFFFPHLSGSQIFQFWKFWANLFLFLLDDDSWKESLLWRHKSFQLSLSHYFFFPSFNF